MLSDDEARDRTHPIREHMRFQRADWRAERVGWIAVAIFVALALAGVFGGGPMSRAEARGGAVTVDYPRFHRTSSADVIQIAVAPQPAGRLTLRVSPPFSDAYAVEGLHPPPLEAVQTAGGVEYVFAVTPGAPVALALQVRARAIGRTPFEIEVAGQGTVRLAPLFFP